MFKIKNKKTIILIILIIIGLIFIVIDSLNNSDNSKNTVNDINEINISTAEESKNFYLQDGKLFVRDNNRIISVPGDFSQMSMSDYVDGNYQSRTDIGNMYFYYKVDGKIYLVISKDSLYNDWNVKELTSSEIGVPEGSKIKYIRISGNYGYIFSINPSGVGQIIKSTTEGSYWSKINTDFALDDNCTLKFLNQFGMTVDGFLTVPNKDGERCDLYRVNDMSEETFEKVDVGNNNFKYFSMPQYLDDSGMAIVMEARENKDSLNIVRFVSTDDGATWKTEEDYQNYLTQQDEYNNQLIVRYDQMVDNLDKNVYVTDFNNYNVTSNEIKISEAKAKEIAEIGFKESADRIASEGIKDTVKEDIELKQVTANSYFTHKYNTGEDFYSNIKRKAYVITKTNDMGCGVSVYVDATTGLIIGGNAFGD